MRDGVAQSIEAAAQEQQLWVSTITPRDIAMLVAKGRLALDRDVMDWPQAALAVADAALLASGQLGRQGVLSARSRGYPQKWQNRPRPLRPPAQASPSAQSSTCSPGMRANSRVLCVTSVNPSLRACAELRHDSSTA